MSLTPADQGYQFQRLADQIAQLAQQVGVLMRQAGPIAQQATVYSFSGGAMCTVEFVATGTRVPMPYLLGYTPVAGHGGYVVDFGQGQRMFIPVSAF